MVKVYICKEFPEYINKYVTNTFFVFITDIFKAEFNTLKKVSTHFQIFLLANIPLIFYLVCIILFICFVKHFQIDAIVWSIIFIEIKIKVLQWRRYSNYVCHRHRHWSLIMKRISKSGEIFQGQLEEKLFLMDSCLNRWLIKIMFDFLRINCPFSRN